MAFMCHMDDCEARMYCTDTRTTDSTQIRVYTCPSCGARMKTEETAIEMLEPGTDLRLNYNIKRHAIEAFIDGEWVSRPTREYRPSTVAMRMKLERGEEITVHGVKVRRKRDGSTE